LLSKPLVSVIIPAFNAQELIGETLDSILAQSYGNIEIIVVNDGSTDQTSKVVLGYGPQVRYYFQNNSGGCAVPRNTGIKHSSGEYLCFMDADDIMVPDRIANQIDFMQRNNQVGLLFCDYRNFNENGLFPESHFQTCPRLWPQLRNQREMIIANPRSLLVQENFGCAGSLMIRKNVLELESGFEPTLTACEDFHFYFRLSRRVPVGVINHVGMMRRLHGTNMSSILERMLSEAIRSRTMLRNSEDDPTVRSNLNKYIADCHESFSRYCADHGQYADAFRKEWQALFCNFCLTRLGAAFRIITRTLFMAIGLHTPKMNCS
jgi:glycosyltransferase involved in cell wall biosynthesis